MKKLMFLFGAMALVAFSACSKNGKEEDGPVVTTTEAIDLSEVAQFIGNSYGDLYYPESRIADPNGNLHPKYMFDGVTAIDYSDDGTKIDRSSYQYWGMMCEPNNGQDIPDEMLDPELTASAGYEVAAYSGAPIFDFGSEMRLASLVFYPYWEPYVKNGFVAKIEVYAYNGEGEIETESVDFWEGDPVNGVPAVKVKDRSVGEWENWTLIGSSDRSEELVNMSQEEILSQKPLLSTAIKFDYDKVPDARYYRFKLWSIAMFMDGVKPWWFSRWSIADLSVERYVVVE